MHPHYPSLRAGRLLAGLVLTLGALSVAARFTPAATLTVAGARPHGAIPAAVSAAHPGGRISIAAGTYCVWMTRNLALSRVRGSGAIIDAMNNGAAVAVSELNCSRGSAWWFARCLGWRETI